MEYKRNHTIVFLLAKHPNPRLNKRIDCEKKLGNVSVICWDKKSVTNFKKIFEDVNYHTISIFADNTNPLKRILPTLQFAHKAICQLKKCNPDIIHTENIDSLFIVWIYKQFFHKKNLKIIYEIADLHPLIINKPNNLFHNIFRFLLILTENICIKSVDLLIITSGKFYQAYYSKMISRKKVLFIPNMPDLSYFKNYKKKQDGEFTVGFIGGIRYKEQMKLLIHAAGDTFHVLFAGFSFDNEIKHLVSGKDNITYLGKYDYESDIASLYSQIDCVYSVYDANDTNVKLALPNKLYEAILCEIPIIVSKGTYLAHLTQSMGIGIAVSHKNPDELKHVLNRLKKDRDYYNRFVLNCKKYKKQINLNLYNTSLVQRLNQWIDFK